MEMQWLWPRFTFEEDDGAGSGKTEDDPGAGASNGEEDKDKGGSEDEEKGKGKKKTRTQQLEDENNRLKREAAERDRKEREEEQKRLKKSGEHEKRADKAEARVAELESQIAERDRNDMVKSAATDLGMEFPEDAVRLLTEDEMKDERAVEGDIRRLKQERPKLFGEVRSSGADIDSDPGDREEERQVSNDRAASPSNVHAGIKRLRSVQRKA